MKWLLWALGVGLMCVGAAIAQVANSLLMLVVALVSGALVLVASWSLDDRS